VKSVWRKILMGGAVLLILIISAVLIAFPSDRIDLPGDLPDLSGPYLGQTPPGRTAVRFAPSIIGEDIHATVTFSPDGTEMFWRPFRDDTNEILFMALENGSWTLPQIVPFASRISDSDDPCYSAGGDRLYFTSWRPLTWLQPFDSKERIWYVDRTAQGWSRPSPVSDAVNDMELHWQLSVSDDETLYFASEGDLYQSSFLGGAHQQPLNLGDVVNSPVDEGHPWIAPDESFLLFSSNRGKVDPGDYDLYLSRRSNQGNWETPLNLGRQVNTPALELYPVLSPDQEYLFFLSNRVSGLSVYWIDFESIKVAFSLE
jgi:Tol biopolymer transport system component